MLSDDALITHGPLDVITHSFTAAGAGHEAAATSWNRVRVPGLHLRAQPACHILQHHLYVCIIYMKV